MLNYGPSIEISVRTSLRRSPRQILAQKPKKVLKSKSCSDTRHQFSVPSFLRCFIRISHMSRRILSPVDVNTMPNFTFLTGLVECRFTVDTQETLNVFIE